MKKEVLILKKLLSIILVAIVIVASSMVPMNAYAKIGKGNSSWKSVKSTTKEELMDITYGNGIYVAVGMNGTIVVSEDGSNWEEADSGITSGLMGVTCSDDKFIAVGYNGVILTSPDGYDWTQIEWYDYYWFFHITGVTWSGDRFVAKGFNHETPTLQEVSIYSDDGENWELDYSDGSLWSEWVGDEFFSATNKDLLYSPDGIGYKSIYEFKKVYISDGACSDSRYVFVGSNGGIVYTDDLDVWKEFRINAGKLPSLTGVVWTGTEFVAVGMKGTIVASKDGKSWKEDKNSPTFADLNQVCYGDGKIVAVGIKGTIIYRAEKS